MNDMVKRSWHEVQTAEPSPLAVARFARGFSQRALAERAGVSKRTVGNVEAHRHVPSLRPVMAITVALGLDDPTIAFPELFTPRQEAPVVVEL